MSAKIFLCGFLLFASINCAIGIIDPGYACNDNNQIQVSGTGTASALPDLVVISVRFSEKGRTSALAVDNLAAKVSRLVDVLTKNGYSARDYETSSVNVYADYQQGQIVGQIASQSLTVRVNALDSKGEKLGLLIDQLSTINGIIIDSVNFDIRDKTPLQKEARAAAFNDASQKAKDYAQFAGLKVGQAIVVSDQETVQAPPVEYGRVYASASFAGKAADSTSVPLGELDVNYRLVVIFTLTI